MEIDADGARWIAGDRAATEAAPNQFAIPTGANEPVPEGLSIPDHAIADPTAHSAGVPEIYRAKIAEISIGYRW